MSLIRPELAAAARRWRETLAGLAAAALGLWAALGALPPLSWLGWAALAGGLALAAGGVQRARFRHAADDADGPGIVVVTEAQISYWGPQTGGAMPLDDLERLELDGLPPQAWILRGASLPDLRIPVTAKGAEDLFDAFNELPGMDTGRLLAALREGGRRRTAIWSRRPESRRDRLLR